MPRSPLQIAQLPMASTPHPDPDRLIGGETPARAAAAITGDAPLPCTVERSAGGEGRFLTRVSGRCLEVKPGEVLVRNRDGGVIRIKHRMPTLGTWESLHRQAISIELAHTLSAAGPSSDLRVFDEDHRLRLWALEGPLPQGCPVPGLTLKLVSGLDAPRLVMQTPRAKASTTRGRTIRIAGTVRSYLLQVMELRADWVSLIWTPAD